MSGTACCVFRVPWLGADTDLLVCRRASYSAWRFLRKLPSSDEEVWLPTSGRQSDDVSQDY